MSLSTSAHRDSTIRYPRAPTTFIACSRALSMPPLKDISFLNGKAFNPSSSIGLSGEVTIFHVWGKRSSVQIVRFAVNRKRRSTNHHVWYMSKNPSISNRSTVALLYSCRYLSGASFCWITVPMTDTIARMMSSTTASFTDEKNFQTFSAMISTIPFLFSNDQPPESTHSTVKLTYWYECCQGVLHLLRTLAAPL